jgi:FKBP-type peptidyl-prolyl cis-trans isomerase (trigger factor)
MNKITINKLQKSKIEGLIEIPSDEFSKYVDRAAVELGKEIDVEGFRKGTAPKELVRRTAGEGKVMDKAAKMAIEENYPKAVLEKQLEPLGYPEVEILKLAKDNPFEFKFTVSVFPQVTLGDYKETAKQFVLLELEVTEEDIKRLKMEKERHEKDHLREDLLDKLRQTARIEVPDVLIGRETERMIEDLRKKTPQALNMSFDEYLKKINKTEKELRDTLDADNEKKIKNFLILQEIAKTEKIEPTEKDINDVIEKVTEGEKKENLDLGHLREYYKDVVKNEKVFSFLEAFFKREKGAPKT